MGQAAGSLGKSLAALSWSLKQPEVRNSPPWFRDLKLGSVQKGSHWGALSEMLENLAPLEEPTAGGSRATWGRLKLHCPALISHTYLGLPPRLSFTRWGRLTPWLYFSLSLSSLPFLNLGFWSDRRGSHPLVHHLGFPRGKSLQETFLIFKIPCFQEAHIFMS